MRSNGSTLLDKSRNHSAVALRRRLQVFRLPHRRSIARVISGSSTLADLAETFPALLFALATGYGTARGRAACTAIVEQGGNLRAAAAALGLPFWLRRMPCDSLVNPLPELPDDAAFAAMVATRLPTNARQCTSWLDRMSVATQLVGRELGMWVASEPRLLPPLTGDDDFSWMMAWAWASCSPTSPGHRLLRKPWHPELGWKRARDEVAIWRKRIDLVGALAGQTRDPWFADGAAHGLEIVQLGGVEDFLAESTAMENCLDQYATHLSYGRVRVFSVRRDGRPVANVELTLRTDDTTIASISQVRGPRNRRAAPHVWQAVHAWLGAQTFRPLEAAPTPRTASRRALRAFWAPYAEALDQAGLTTRLGPPIGMRPVRGTRHRGGEDAPASHPTQRDAEPALPVRRPIGNAA